MNPTLTGFYGGCYTALGDARWAARIFDRVMGSA